MYAGWSANIPFNNPTVTSCCQNAFCLECIVESLKYKSECPYCRCKITPDSLKTITNEAVPEIDINLENNEILNKIDTLVNVIKSSSENSKFLITVFANVIN